MCYILIIYFWHGFINKCGIQKYNKITRGLSCTGVEYNNKLADFSKQVHTKLFLRIKKNDFENCWGTEGLNWKL